MANPPIRHIAEIGNDLVSALKELARCKDHHRGFVNSTKIAASALHAAEEKYQQVLGEFEYAVTQQSRNL